MIFGTCRENTIAKIKASSQPPQEKRFISKPHHLAAQKRQYLKRIVMMLHIKKI